ncbi:motile sperm domain-containing protein 2 [Trichonephila inaurata madagascariensis]|uniref:Motile sperm domain-containing protein 2 n=1 Tax=Trichonephila inaurata madagascariensis TaxID=2747483 RepID=A0A8X6XQH4_9ARAC|nr:motile sperm domain-containing protein 2 [Trichonephila inaurata madagascariensis]
MVVPVDSSGSTDQELYIQLRNTFLENLNSNGNYDDYEEADIDRIRNDDKYCRRFILHKKGVLEDALEMVDEALRWRKSFGVKDVTLAALPLEFFQAKAVFPFNKDKEGNPIIMILVRYHKKAPEFAKELRRFVIYWVELMEEQTKGGRMTVIMSCAGAGMSNLDLDLIKFLITLFRSYYPDSLANILIFDMPWILQPAWKIIKAWLPEDFVDKIKFVNKTSIQEYVTADNLPVDMGGTDTTEYVPPTQEDINNAKNGTEPKRVHFSHNPESLSDIKGVSNESGISKPSQVVITDDYTVIGGILKISPATHLLFNKQSEDETNDVVIKLSCVSEKTISFKVKTNNIESYRVKPSLGVIRPGESIEITVILLPDYQPLPTDKFLIMGMEISDPTLSTPALNTLWKNTSSNIIADHKLKCAIKDDGEPSAAAESELDKSLKNLSLILTNLENRIQTLDAKQTSILFRQTVSLCLTVFLMTMFLGHIFLHADSFWPSVFEKYF